MTWEEGENLYCCVRDIEAAIVQKVYISIEGQPHVAPLPIVQYFVWSEPHCCLQVRSLSQLELPDHTSGYPKD